MALIPGNMAPAQERAFRDNLRKLYERFLNSGRKRTVGTLVGSVRTKQFPDNAITGQQVRIIFVADVRLREFAGQPIVRDVLVSQQAQALVAASDADGLPVAVEISASGTATIVGRAGYQSSSQSHAYYTIDDLNNNDMSYVFGLRLRVFVTGDAALLVRINTWRAARSLSAFSVGSSYFADPQLDVHGVEYYAGYIGLEDGGRFSAAIPAVVCADETVGASWYDDSFWYGTSPYPLGNWYGEVVRTVCAEVP